MAGEATPGGGPQLPSGNIVDAVWIRTVGRKGPANRTFMNKGYGPYSFMLNAKDFPALVETGDKNWQSWFGANRSAWPFNTECCATDFYFQQAFCDEEG